MNRMRDYGGKVSRNHTRTVWVLKCDIRKFFANIDHGILINMLKLQIKDADVIWLLEQVIRSFHTKDESAIGLPLGNLTSQLLVNVYMNKFDQFAKRELKICHYVRYADDFVILHYSKEYLENLVPKISGFVERKLKISLHPGKLSIKTLASGVDFLGWAHFPYHRVLRTSAKRRMFKKLDKKSTAGTIASYRGLLSYGNTYKLDRKITEDLY
jgi:retron-type reverse transcriptase